MDLSELQSLLTSLQNVRTICVGDLMVDRFVYGEVSRISAEAPVPIMARRSEATMLGAAGNVARNIAALGAEVALIGVVGDDRVASEAQALAKDIPGLKPFFVPQVGRPTSLKTRFVSAGQQLLRVDHEEVGGMDAAVQAKLAAMIAEAARGAGAILLSDYGKGVVTPTVIAACLDAAKASGAPLVVDSKSRGFAHYGEADLVKPNASELAHATGLPTDTDDEIEAALAHALAHSRCRAILVTRSAKGMSLGVRGQPVQHFPGRPRQVFDVSGAGDTALAALGVALAAKAPLERAVEFGLLASGVAVEKPGTAIVLPNELVEAEIAVHRAPAEAKVATVERMVAEIARWRAMGLKVGFTNGCFDILHRGHVAYLAQAASWCDRLIVGLNSDRSIKALKGEGRPINDLESRALVLAGLGSVSLVAPFDEDTPIKLIEAARPDILIKGADYSIEGVVGSDFVLSYGGEVKLAALIEGYSTTAAIAKMAGAK
ncbi:MAG: D-glycero-beta-D-manno-heptose 1-phosphate adenylyltransferase [Caulobacteraceae bacterium]|nr:D-glycero-beta-D-manno-heptose 1-phosphate adenylyltransferase [Caulobacteraceae bacterium]